VKIALIAPTYLPAIRANTIQVMKMAQALGVLGHDLVVLVPGKGAANTRPTWEELSHHYGISHPFDIVWLNRNPRFRNYDYGLRSVRWALDWGADLIYTRLPQAAAIASRFGMPTIHEIHDLPHGLFGSWLLAQYLKGGGAKVLVVITDALREAILKKNHKIKHNRRGLFLPIIVVPDGVDLERYNNIPAPQKARQYLSSKDNLTLSSFTVGYSGHLYKGRGIDLILDIAGALPDLSFLIVGGENKDVELLQQTITARGLQNIILTGFVPNAELPEYQASCDVLLMPYQNQVSASSGGDIAKYLSPMKLFEYMACGRAIISSDLPVLREILNVQNAILLPPDDLNSWTAAIQDLNGNPDIRTRLANQALKDVQQYSWKNRARKILSAVETSTLSSTPAA